MPYKKCKICEKKFYSKPNSNKRGKYCSRKCYLEDKKSECLVIKCDNCGKQISRPKWRFNTKPLKHHFCSTKCYGQYRSKHSDEYLQSGKKNMFFVAKELNEKCLREEYEKGGLRIKEIAKKHNCSYGVVSGRMKSYGIETNRGRYSIGSCEAYWRRYFQKKYSSCQNCGWDKDRCDVAHKKSRKLGGKYIESNLLYLCPNCHRLYDKGKLKI